MKIVRNGKDRQISVCRSARRIAGVQSMNSKLGHNMFSGPRYNFRWFSKRFSAVLAAVSAKVCFGRIFGPAVFGNDESSGSSSRGDMCGIMPRNFPENLVALSIIAIGNGAKIHESPDISAIRIGNEIELRKFERSCISTNPRGTDSPHKHFQTVTCIQKQVTPAITRSKPAIFGKNRRFSTQNRLPIATRVEFRKTKKVISKFLILVIFSKRKIRSSILAIW